MSLFAITVRLRDDESWRLRALDHAIRTISPRTLIYDETPGFYLVKAETDAQEILDGLVAAGLRPKQDFVLIINLSQPDYAQSGSNAPQRLKVLMAAR